MRHDIATDTFSIHGADGADSVDRVIGWCMWATIVLVLACVATALA